MAYELPFAMFIDSRYFSAQRVLCASWRRGVRPQGCGGIRHPLPGGLPTTGISWFGLEAELQTRDVGGTPPHEDHLGCRIEGWTAVTF